MANFPKIDQSELSLGQGEIVTLLNDIIWRLCCLTQAVALNIANAPAGGESNGDCYLVGGSPSGSFGGFSANDVAMMIGNGWVNVTPQDGWQFYVQATGILYTFNGSSWAEIGSHSPSQSPSSSVSPSVSPSKSPSLSPSLSPSISKSVSPSASPST